MHVRVLKFHVWIPHEKIADIFLARLYEVQGELL